MRTKYSLRNITVGLVSQVLLIAVGFVSRKIFIITLGNQMLGVNGLFTSILSMLSLTDLGIGTAIVCNLYKPLADRDEEKIVSLVQFYAKAYRIIGSIILGLGLMITPFLKLLIKDNIDQTFISVIFLLFLSDTVMSYFFAHKRSLIYADQRSYLVTMVSTATNITASVFQIIILLLTHDYVLYMFIKISIRIIENLIVAAIANKRYPFIRTKQIHKLETQTKDRIKSNTKALALHYVGKYMISGTDNIIISRFLGTISVGFYSNYQFIIQTLTNSLSPFSTGLIASFGNLVAKENSAKAYDVFKKGYFVNFVVFNFAAVTLLCLLNPFIALWINSQSLLPMPVVAVLSLNFYLACVSSILNSMRTSAGLFRVDRYLPIALSAINLIVSIALVQIIGIIGVFLGTLMCLLVNEISVLPSIVYRNIFEIPVRKYYKRFVVYFMTTVLSAGITLYISESLCPQSGILTIIFRLAVCLTVPNVIIILLYGRTEEYKYARELLRNVLSKMKDMIKNRKQSRRAL